MLTFFFEFEKFNFLNFVIYNQCTHFFQRVKKNYLMNIIEIYRCIQVYYSFSISNAFLKFNP